MKPPLYFIVVRKGVPVWIRGFESGQEVLEPATPEECAEELSRLRSVLVEISRNLLLLHGTASSFTAGKLSADQAKLYFEGSLAKIRRSRAEFKAADWRNQSLDEILAVYRDFVKAVEALAISREMPLPAADHDPLVDGPSFTP